MNTVAEMIKPIPGPFFAVLIGYFVLMAIIGYVSSKQTNNLKDFFVMSGKAGAIVAGFAYFSTQYSMSTFMGCPASCYKAGFSGLSITVPGVEGPVTISVLDIHGRTVTTETLRCATDCEKTLDLTGLSQGAYFVRIVGDSVASVRKLVVK